MSRFALLNARIIDPEHGESRGGLFIDAGVIHAIGPDVTADNIGSGALTVDCAGDCIGPGLIDMQAFAGEPGFAYRETISSITRAAAAGGVTTLAATPNTQPVMDDPTVVDFLKRFARDHGLVRVLPLAALTKGLNGEEISEIGMLLEAGAVAFSNGPRSVDNALVLRRALTYVRDFDALTIHFAHDQALAGDGVMNEGEWATRLGLTGLPSEAETIVLERDMHLVALTGARYHAAMVSCSQSLDVIRRAKARGLPVSCATSINHLTLNEGDIGDYRTFLKLLPPLRSEAERQQLVAAVREGLIDVVVSDHDPQDVEVKRLPFAEAAHGAIGIETMLAAALRLVHSGDWKLPQLFQALSLRPAQVLRLPQGRIDRGAPADLFRFDPDEPFVLDPANLHSRSKNTPFAEARLQGVVKSTWVGGDCVYDHGQFAKDIPKHQQ